MRRTVAANVDGKITAHGARLSLVGVGGTDQSSAASNGTATLPDHRDDGARAEVVHQRGEEGALGEVRVVLLGELLGRGQDLDCHCAVLVTDEVYIKPAVCDCPRLTQLVALALEAADDLTDQVLQGVNN